MEDEKALTSAEPDSQQYSQSRSVSSSEMLLGSTERPDLLKWKEGL